MRSACVIFVVILSGLAGCASSSTVAGSEEGYEPSNADLKMQDSILHQTTPIADHTATLRVNGLSCPKCASNVDLTLADVKGVDKVEKVDLSSGEVKLSFVHGQHPSPATLATAVKKAGYTLVGITTP